MKCKNCGAEVTVNEDQERAFCNYCGAELDISKKGSAVHEITSFLNKADKRRMDFKENEAIRADIRGREKREAGNKIFIPGLIIILGMMFLAGLIQMLK